jgi:type VII secretion protein EccE
VTNDATVPLPDADTTVRLQVTPPVRRRHLVSHEPGRLRRAAIRIIGWQVGLIAAALAVITTSRVIAVAVLLAAVLLAATAVRWRGRWLDQWLVTYWRYRWRKGRPASPVEVHDFADRAGNKVGVLSSGEGYSAILGIRPRQASAEGLAPALDGLLDTLDAPGVRAIAVQLVTMSSPGGSRRYWVAVRLDPHECRAAVNARGGGPAGAVHATGGMALRLAERLRAAGVEVRVPDGAGLRADLAACLGVRSDLGLEKWKWWAGGAGHQVCYRPRRLPRDRVRLLESLHRTAGEPAQFCVGSLLIDRAPKGQRRAELIWRIAVPAQAAARTAARTAAAGLGTRVWPLDGAHGPGVRASLPRATRLAAQPTHARIAE